MANSIARRAGAELIGTFGLVTAGCSAIIASNQGGLPSIGVALAFGIVIAIMVAATAHISGGHINPAVSIGLSVTRHLPWKDLPWYLLAQVLGATLASALLLWIFGPHALAQTVNVLGTHTSTWQGLGAEMVATAFLVFVISATATDARGIGKLAPFAIGATILLGALWAGPVSGASMNPARSLGPMLISGNWANLRDVYWIYLVGPIAGGIIGAVLYQLIRQPAPEAQSEKTSTAETPAVSVSRTLPTTPRATVGTPRPTANNNRKQKSGVRR